ncbi:MAG: phosphopantetheine-binding protein [Lachnospiraceae bacterium]|nr:phosphopantetheine-binding protein [Lachnospiraceae bacterium]
MNMQDEIITIIEDVIGAKGSVSSEKKIKDLSIDSLDIFEIVVRIEDVYGINIADEPMAEFETIEDIIKFYESKVEEMV